MPDQLSLFPSKDLNGDQDTILDSDLNALDEMFFASRRYRNSVEYTDLVHFISRFPKYSAFNGLLLYLQNPDITHVATAGNWWRNFQRKPIYQAKPLVILAPMSPIRFVYDIRDTEGEPLTSIQLNALEARDEFSKENLEKAIHNCKLHGIWVHEVPSNRLKPGMALSLTYENRNRYPELNPESWAKYLIPVDTDGSYKEKYAALALGLGHIFCGHLGIDDAAWWPDRRDLEQTPAIIEAESVAYLVCQRKNLKDPAKQFLLPYRETDCEMPAFGLNAALNATHYIEEMGKAFWKTPKRKSRYKP